MLGKTVFTTGQVARICKVAPRTITKWFDSGRLRGYRLPGRSAGEDRRIPRESLLAFLTEHGFPLGELGPKGRTRVLLVGAPQCLCDRLGELLPEADGYGHERAQNGFEAGAKTLEFQPALVVIDLGMGRAEALAVARGLESLHAERGMEIVALAGEDEPDLSELGVHGFSEALRQPVDVAVLAELIKSLVGEGAVPGPRG